MRSAQAHSPAAYNSAPGLNWQRPLALAVVVAFSVLMWVGIGWVIAQLV